MQNRLTHRKADNAVNPINERMKGGGGLDSQLPMKVIDIITDRFRRQGTRFSDIFADSKGQSQ